MVKKHFSPEDYFSVRNHMIGTGMIGGKACGMLLSRAIVRNLAWDINEVLEPHDSFFIGSDVYYTYIVDQWILGYPCSSKRGNRIFFSGRRICQTSEKWCIFRGNEKSFFTYSGILWTGSFYCAFQQYSGGWLRKRICRKI